ncbi:hypothetical protein RJ640_023360 [Escallonia rubra]|uniref:C2 domain-containing protein n=1 Tax=Escallonia rubra TaxID=112253 RepID=A0AA88RIS4_9ASTE|nr:hypothetical protein RJ640_023360 [Escallonia rubra]
MAATRTRPPSKPLDLEITVVSAKHLQNVNWRSGGDLKPYAILWTDPDRRLATKSDDSGSTRPVWNERFLLPLTLPPHDSLLTLEIFHSKPSETPKPLGGVLRFPLKDLVDPDDSTKLRTFDLRRPSGRPQGKIRLKLAIRERPLPDYHIAPQPSYYYNTAPPSQSRDFRSYSSLPPPPPPQQATSMPPSPSQSPAPYPYAPYSDPYSGYYAGYYPQLAPVPTPRPYFDQQSSYGRPSAPVDYTPYDQKQKGGRMGLGAGLAVGAVVGALGGLALDEGLKYEEDKIADNVASELSAADDYTDYRANY